MNTIQPTNKTKKLFTALTVICFALAVAFIVFAVSVAVIIIPGLLDVEDAGTIFALFVIPWFLSVVIWSCASAAMISVALFLVYSGVNVLRNRANIVAIEYRKTKSSLDAMCVIGFGIAALLALLFSFVENIDSMLAIIAPCAVTVALAIALLVLNMLCAKAWENELNRVEWDKSTIDALNR